MRSDDPGLNIEIQRQLNEMIATRTAMLEKQSEIMRDQVRISIEMMRSMSEGADFDAIEGRLTSLGDSISRAASEAAGFAEASSSAGDMAHAAFSRTGAGATAAAGSVKGLGNQLRGAMQLIDGLLKIASAPFMGIAAFAKTAWKQMTLLLEVTMSVGRAMAGIAIKLISIPFSILNQLQETAAGLAQKFLELEKKTQEIVENFGTLSSGPGAAVYGAFKNLTAQTGSLAGSGRTLASVFGYGVDGISAAMEYVNTLAKDMGATFSLFQSEISQNAQAMAVYQKSLGLTGEQIKGLAAAAKATGKPLTTTLQDIGKLSLVLSKKYGLGVKDIAKDLTYMTANTAKFGKMTKEQMAASATYVRKLGLEIEQLNGVIDSWDMFETAAENASKLAQAFGMNVDVMRMMNEEDPSKRLDMIREAFFATGQSINDLNRQQKDYLAKSSGLPAQMLDLALSAENAGKSYDELVEASKKAGYENMSQEEILRDLATNIKEIIRDVQYAASIFKNFFNGLMAGLLGVNGEGLDLTTVMAKLMMYVEKIGYAVGIMLRPLIESTKIVGALTSYFDKLSLSMGGVTQIFEQFVNTFSVDPQRAVLDLIDNLKMLFGWILDPNNEVNKGITSAYKSILQGITAIIVPIGDELLGIAREIIMNTLDNLINELPNAIRQYGSGAKKSGRTLVDLILDAGVLLLDIGAKLLTLFMKSFQAVLENPKLRNYAIGLLIGAFAFIFGPAVLSGIYTFITTLASGIVSALMGAFALGLIGGGGAAAGGAGVAGFGSTIMGWISGGIASIAGPQALITIAALAIAAFGVVFGGIAKVVTAVGREKFSEIFNSLFGLKWLKDAGIDLGSDVYTYLEWVADWIFGGLYQFFGGVMDTFTGLFSGDVDKFLSGLGDIFLGAGKFITASLGSVVGAIVAAIALAVKYGLTAIATMILSVAELVQKAWEWSGINAEGAAANRKRLEEWKAMLKGAEATVQSTADEMKKTGEKAGETAGDGLFGGFSKKFKESAERSSTSSSMDPFANQMKTRSEMTAYEIQNEADSINRGVRKLNEMMDMIDKSALSRAKANVEKMSPDMDKVSEIVSKFDSMLSPFSKSDQMADSLTNIYSFFDKIAGINPGSSIAGMSNAMDNLISGVGVFGEKLNVLGTRAQLVETVNSLVPDSVKNMLQELSDENVIKPIDINGRVTTTNGQLGIKEQVIKIERKPINMTVNLNVQMDTAQLATNISKFTNDYNKQSGTYSPSFDPDQIVGPPQIR